MVANSECGHPIGMQGFITEADLLRVLASFGHKSVSDSELHTILEAAAGYDREARRVTYGGCLAATAFATWLGIASISPEVSLKSRQDRVRRQLCAHYGSYGEADAGRGRAALPTGRVSARALPARLCVVRDQKWMKARKL